MREQIDVLHSIVGNFVKKLIQEVSTAAIFEYMMHEDPITLLRRHFGYTTFRPGQEEIIRSVSAGKDCLVVMPTGGGKSICYQIPALMNPGLTVVVSPLISLMQDQVSALKANGIAAAFLNSSMTSQEQQTLINDLLMAEIRLLYVSPEKLISEDTQRILSSIKVNLIAIDEAHCISQWGHDFRPEYAMIGSVRSYLPNVPFIALTATADRLTRQDIASRLMLREPEVFISSFDRPNLHLKVLPGQKRIQQITRFISRRPHQAGIIYCLSRKSTESLAAKLQQAGYSAGFYHAGMTAKARHRIQEQFLNDEVPIICATIAFGMGIDKPNVRWVIHYNLPKNLEGYYQEIGRAGRDGLPADTVLFFSYGDVIQQRQFLEDSGQKEVMESKLERMHQYATALTCRRKILLQYFGETMPKPCGHCDVCESPPETFDGTIIAQKALSAVARTKEKAGLHMLIDVLRGSQRQEILSQGFDQIKTYGAGRDVPARDWQHFLHQLIHAGFLEIAYERNNALSLTPLAKEVLLGNRPVALVKPVMAEKATAGVPASKKDIFYATLEQHLKRLRMALAKESNLRPYHIFTDATLEDLLQKLPLILDDLPEIEGIGAAKQKKYGEDILEVIQLHLLKTTGKDSYYPKGCSARITLACYLEGWDLETMAMKRQLKSGTICAHLIKLTQEGYNIDLASFLETSDLKAIRSAYKSLGKAPIREYFDFLEGGQSYDNIRLGLAVLGA